MFLTVHLQNECPFLSGFQICGKGKPVAWRHCVVWRATFRIATTLFKRQINKATLRCFETTEKLDAVEGSNEMDSSSE